MAIGAKILVVEDDPDIMTKQLVEEVQKHLKPCTP
jgi:hypothetical protein